MPDDRNSQEAMMRERLLRAIDRRDPWNAVDLMDWLRFHFPEYLMRGTNAVQQPILLKRLPVNWLTILLSRLLYATCAISPLN
ncbi:hypothetical protein ACC696_35750 [Rhizobium ruizarguesonis]|uniref:Uncharacterized protein n=1 Tax=Rhizobium ruizarguesonis TaxID=2081791 RepID=A0ABY1X7U2_9HYPH|nr:hypothetical protein [Rhizobium ruizarguesonis]TAX81175.1 hypothetical protein ELH98_08905 [Rhizobium ruizarguesonis]TBE22910.1 hypothetical protein ELH08_08390 [Rhizobium ruizarguesonis]